MFNEAINYFLHNCYKYKILKQNEYNKFEQSHCSTLQENETNPNPNPCIWL